MPVVLISGGTGLVGANLTRHLLERNYEVIILTRDKNRTSKNPKISYSYWNIKGQIIDVEAIKKADHIIHLSGAGVMDKKWTADYKKIILESRTKSAELIIKSLEENEHHVKTFVSASAIGWYGEDANPLIRREGFVETDLPAKGFLGETCLLWEAASDPVKSLGIRLVTLRCGIVLSNEGGAFKEFKTPLRFGVAAIFGNGKQIISWIHIDDLCRMYCDAIENNYLHGSYNAVAPEPVSQKKFMITLGEKMRNRFFTPIHIPVFILKLFLGKRSMEILKSATVSNKKMKAAAFTFLYPTLQAALDELTSHH
ncbi:MAG TPA: TIGR01777 family oxidoreductase [Hanamia sp.]|jgi:TIGR01777 family protein|nr:TIGR01777 family oxidoreductase [Hanamia sp.]